VRESGGHWHDEAPTVIMGMSSIEWSAYLRDEVGVADADVSKRDALELVVGGGGGPMAAL
jgi:hypothetical protein